MSVDKVGCIRGKEYGRPLEIFRSAPACGRGLRHDKLIKRMTAAVRLTLAEGSRLGCGNVARSDAIALNVVLTIFRADIAGQHLQSALGSGIGGNSLTAQLTHHGADVDDLSVSLFDHVGNHGLGTDEWCIQVDIDHSAEIGCGHFNHRDSLNDTGIIDKNINDTDFFFDLANGFLDLIFLGHIADIALGFNTGLTIVFKPALKLSFTDIIENKF